MQLLTSIRITKDNTNTVHIVLRSPIQFNLNQTQMWGALLESAGNGVANRSHYLTLHALQMKL